MAKKTQIKTGSIDDITPQEWNEMNRKHLAEKDLIDTTGDVQLSFLPEDTITISDKSYDTIVKIQEPTPDYKFREGELIQEFK